jgi:hypothetical protein
MESRLPAGVPGLPYPSERSSQTPSGFSPMHVSGVSRVHSVASLSAKSCLLRTDYAILSVVGRHAAWSARHPDGGEHEGRWQVKSPFRVTLNYRRDDTSGHAGRLYDALAERSGSEHVFMDIDAIEPGVDFGEAIRPSCGIPRRLHLHDRDGLVAGDRRPGAPSPGQPWGLRQARDRGGAQA